MSSSRRMALVRKAGAAMAALAREERKLIELSPLWVMSSGKGGFVCSTFVAVTRNSLFELESGS